MHVLEARAMRLRSPAPLKVYNVDSPSARAAHAFTVKSDDRDVKQACDVPILGPVSVRVRDERPDREQRPKRHQPNRRRRRVRQVASPRASQRSRMYVTNGPPRAPRT